MKQPPSRVLSKYRLVDIALEMGAYFENSELFRPHEIRKKGIKKRAVNNMKQPPSRVLTKYVPG